MDERIFSGVHFDIMGYQRGKGKVLHVFIEGDGKAWRNRRHPSNNPTPENPVALRLAVADRHEAILYLARPCQFVENSALRNCIIPLWTSARFSEPIISDMNVALDQAKKIAQANSLVLIGYSGGGAVALLLAERRNDVDLVVTVAGNVDHAFWTKLHGVSPLRDSLNPADYAGALQTVPQLHIVSNDDDVVPPSVVKSYIAKMSDSGAVHVVEVDGIEHAGDWQDIVSGIMIKNVVQ